jgi:sugar diacid utilization regulator
MSDREMIDALRDQMSNLCGVFALSMMLFDRVDDSEILKLVVSAVPALGPCRVEGTYLAREDPRRGGDGDPALRDQLGALNGADSPVEIPGAAWSWAYPLRAMGGHSGYIVVSADAEPSTDEQFLVRTLAQQAGAALNSAALYHCERAASEELRDRNTQLGSVNQKLTHAVADLERRTRMHESLTTVSATGGGPPEIADALHELTGLAVVVEDKFGNLLGWSGGEQPVPRSRPPRDRTELLNRARRVGHPTRHRDRVLALAQPRDEVLGVLALIDPQRQAGEFELIALEGAAMVLAVELAHRRSLAETELRLRGDLVDELLTGTDDESALARSAALDHDLRPPHQILVVTWPGVGNLEKVARAVDQVVTRMTQARALLTRRQGKVVVVAPTREGDGTAYDWAELHRLLSTSLPSPGGAVGVGRRCANPSELPRSHTDALRALGVRQTSVNHSGVTTFDDLGFYRMLGTEEGSREIGEFIREWLGALIDYDAVHHYDLVTTLWQYYESGGNYDATARALLIHRSTLRYRLRRIRELTGYDLTAVDARLNLHIASRAWQILQGPS